MKFSSDKVLVIGVAIAIILAYFYLPWEDSFFGLLVDNFLPLNWDEILPRNIVKNSVIIELENEENGMCTMSTRKFIGIVEHDYFIKSEEFINKVQYDKESETVTLPCDELPGEQARLHVWYVKEEAPKHGTKYEYFITPVDILTTKLER